MSNFILIPPDRFFLTKLNVGNYSVDNAHAETQDFVTKITDISKHTIILFESADPVSYHRNVADELHILIDRISYDVLYLTGRIPTVNLISHSRGGLTSMMHTTGYREGSKTDKVEYDTNDDGDFYEIAQEYSENGTLINDHPFNVKALYSLGTPYSGTKLNQPWAQSILASSFNQYSAKNILDPVIQGEIKNNWEATVVANPQLKLYANAGEISLNFLLGLIGDTNKELAVRIDGLDKVKVCEGCDVCEKCGACEGCEICEKTCEGCEKCEAIGVCKGCQERSKPLDGIAETADVLLYMVADEWIPAFQDILHTIESAVAGVGIGATIMLPFPYNMIPLSITATVEGLCITLDINAQYIKEQALRAYNEPIIEKKLLIIDQTILSYYRLIYDFQGHILGMAGDSLGVSSFADLGDLFVDTNSQLAVGFSNVEPYTKIFSYENITESRQRHYCSFAIVPLLMF